VNADKFINAAGFCDIALKKSQLTYS